MAVRIRPNARFDRDPNRILWRSTLSCNMACLRLETDKDKGEDGDGVPYQSGEEQFAEYLRTYTNSGVRSDGSQHLLSSESPIIPAEQDGSRDPKYPGSDENAGLDVLQKPKCRHTCIVSPFRQPSLTFRSRSPFAVFWTVTVSFNIVIQGSTLHPSAYLSFMSRPTPGRSFTEWLMALEQHMLNYNYVRYPIRYSIPKPAFALPFLYLA